MLFKTLFSVFSLVAAVPPPSPCIDESNQSSSPTLPKNGGPKELTNPPEGHQLLHMALGLGIQNYTCADAGASPVPVGALAILWDARPLFPNQPGPESLPSLADFEAVPGRVLERLAGGGGGDQGAIIKSNASSSSQQQQQPQQQQSLDDPFPRPADLRLPADEGIFSPPQAVTLSFLGHHFFDAAGVPTFVIFDKNSNNSNNNNRNSTSVNSPPAIRLPLKKDEAVDAPPAADPGPDRTGAVSWLKLSVVPGTTTSNRLANATDDGDAVVAIVPPSSPQVKMVYRVITAGGNSHGCRAAGVDSTTYAATYWFFG